MANEGKAKTRSPKSRAMIVREIAFNSIQSQRVVERSYDGLKKALFRLGVIMQIIAEPEAVRAADKEISRLFNEVSVDLSKANKQHTELLSNNGIEGLAGYSVPKSYSLTIDTPKIGRFLEMIIELDQLMGIIDTLWLHAVLTDQQKKESNYRWQQRLVKMASRIIELETQSRVELYGAEKQSEIEEALAEVEEPKAESPGDTPLPVKREVA